MHDSEFEERAVSWEELAAGIKATAGRKIVFIVGSTGAAAGPSQPENPTTGGGTTAPPRAETGALDLQLVASSRKPAGGALVELTLPDGSKRSGRTDPDGHFKVDGLPRPGRCTLLLPDAPDAPAGANGGDAASPGDSASLPYRAGMQLEVGASPVVALPLRLRRSTLTGAHFETNKTFLLPSAMQGIRELRGLQESFGALSVLVTGHTDTVGDAAYNLGLSVERAEAIAAFLTNAVADWTKRYQPHSHSAAWGVREDQYMLAHLPEGQAPYYAGRVDGYAGPKTAEAYRRFQADQGLAQSGSGDEATRTALVTGYMQLEGTTLPQTTTVLTHGCGLTHLAESTGPNVDRLANRRVEVFLFEEEVTPSPETPCPPAGCAGYQQWVGRAGKPVDLDQPPAQLAVSVVGPDGQPVAGADVHLAGLVSRDVQSDTGGRAVFADLPPGDYRLLLVGGDFSAPDQQLPLAPGENSARIDAARVQQPLRLQLLGDTGTPAPAGTRYRLTAGAEVREGAVGEDGLLEEKGLPAESVGAKVVVEWVGVLPATMVGPQEKRRGGGGEKAMAFAADDGGAAGPSAQPAATPSAQTRASIYVAGSVAQMKTEAAQAIDPATLPPILPSWQSDGDAFIDDKDPGHFLSRRIVGLRSTLRSEPNPLPAFAWDNRLYDTHPLEVRYFPQPIFPAPTGAPPGYLNREEAKPASGGAPAPVRAPPPWYNVTGGAVPLMGRAGDFRDAGFQEFLSAVTKRMVRHWMGELIYMTDPSSRPALNAWFATADGKRHFSHWSQLLAPHIGYRPPKDGLPQGAHTAGKGGDLNYDYNPWCPLFGSELRTMVGEEGKDYSQVGRIYDRALRLGVPKSGADASAQADHFGQTYYRNHWDWTPANIAEVYRKYQILHWSLQFYFDLLYRRTTLPKYLCCYTITDDGDHGLPPGKSPALRCDISCDRDLATDIRTCPVMRPRPAGRTNQEIFDALLALVRAGDLPPDAAFLCESKVVPAAVAARFTSVEIRYPFRDKHTQQQLTLTEAALSAVPAAEQDPIGGAIAAQIRNDHAVMRPVLNASGGDRDPCRGVFNQGYELVLAFGQMLTDARNVRTFGLFTSGAAGDLQHFDYGYSTRPI